MCTTKQREITRIQTRVVILVKRVTILAMYVKVHGGSWRTLLLIQRIALELQSLRHQLYYVVSTPIPRYKKGSSEEMGLVVINEGLEQVLTRRDLELLTVERGKIFLPPL